MVKKSVGAAQASRLRLTRTLREAEQAVLDLGAGCD